MALLEDIKKSIRLKNNAFDTEIQDLVDASKQDLVLAGVDMADEGDALIKRAITLYVKGNFGYDEKSERYIKAYESLKIVLALCLGEVGDV